MKIEVLLTGKSFVLLNTMIFIRWQQPDIRLNHYYPNQMKERMKIHKNKCLHKNQKVKIFQMTKNSKLKTK